MNYSKIIAITGGVILLLGVFSGWPYAYYQVLRWVVVIAGVVNAYQAYEEKRTGWIWVMIAIAILFNPVAPIYLDKGLWNIMDIVAAILMFSYVSTGKNEK